MVKNDTETQKKEENQKILLCGEIVRWGILNHVVKERESYYEHTMEGPDDMPAHAKCSLFGVSLNIPITNERLNMGTWQGIYLCEFRNHGGSRKIVATIYK